MPDLGTKHECTNCSTRFYDLGKPDPICPKCGLNQNAEEEEEPAEGKVKKEGDDEDLAKAPAK